MKQLAKSLIANAARQAHWQVRKTHSIPIAIGTKELAFCSAWVTVFRLTQLKCKPLLTDREKGERTTGDFVQAWHDVVSFSFCSLSASARAGQTSLNFVTYLVHLFFNQRRLRADVFQIPCLHKALFVSCKATAE